MGRRRDGGRGADDASYAATEDEIREFLRSEAERDPGVIGRFRAARGRAKVDYRPRARKIFDDAVEENVDAESFGDMEVDLSPLLDEAESLRERKHYAEAGRLYRHTAEVIGEYMPGFDEWEGDYKEVLRRCVDGSARCAKEDGDPDAWREWISYAVGMFLDAARHTPCWGGKTSRLDPIYRSALERECRGKGDLEHWLSELGRRSGNGGGAGPRSAPVLLMKAHVAGRLGGAAGRDRQLALGYRDSAEACAAYVRRLRRTSPREAKAVAAYGAQRFPSSRAVQSLALSLCPKSSAEYRVALRRMFVLAGSWRHFDELKMRSPSWTADRSRLVKELRHDRRLLGGVLDREGMADALARAVFASKWLDDIERHHASLATPRHGSRLFGEYKRRAEKVMATAKHDGHYAVVSRCLRRMRTIPGQERQFKLYVGQLRKRYGRRRALMARLDRL